MKTLNIGKLKANFSQIINEIKTGEEITISYGKKHEKIAVILPYKKYFKNKKRKIGILEHKASYKVHGGFKVTDEELCDL